MRRVRHDLRVRARRRGDDELESSDAVHGDESVSSVDGGEVFHGREGSVVEHDLHGGVAVGVARHHEGQSLRESGSSAAASGAERSAPGCRLRGRPRPTRRRRPWCEGGRGGHGGGGGRCRRGCRVPRRRGPGEDRRRTMVPSRDADVEGILGAADQTGRISSMRSQLSA
jgi:hypothetical protein